MSNGKNRITKIKKKYGENAFKKFGARGGNPILNDHALVKAYKEGRVKIIR